MLVARNAHLKLLHERYSVLERCILTKRIEHK